MLAHVPSFGLNPRGSGDFPAYPVPKACMHVLGTGVPRRLGVARSASSPKAAQALGCSLTPGLRISFGRVTCMARAASVPGLWTLGFLLLCGVCAWVRVVLGLGFGNPAGGWGLGWVCLGTVCGFAPLFPAGVRGVCGWALVLACIPPDVGRVLGLAWLCARSSCSPPFPILVCGVGVCWGPTFGCAPPLLGEVLLGCACGRACPPLALALPGGPPVARGCAGVAVGGVCPPASPLAFFLWGGFVLWVAGLPGLWSRVLCPPIPSLPGRVVCCLCFFLFKRGVCPRVLGVPSPGGPLPSACCCRFWLAGPPATLWGVLSSVPSGWGVWPPLVVLLGGVVAVGRSRAPPPLLSFSVGGSAYSSLCLPRAGARTGRHSVWFSGLLLVVAFCRAVPRPHGLGGLCTRWPRRPSLPD